MLERNRVPQKLRFWRATSRPPAGTKIRIIQPEREENGRVSQIDNVYFTAAEEGLVGLGSLMISPVFKPCYDFILRPVNTFDLVRVIATGSGRCIEEIRRSVALDSLPYHATCQ